MKWTAPRGTRDILPGEVEQWQWLEQTFAEVCRLYDFREIRIPTFEHTEVFTRGVGDSSDIVRKEMYTFLDKGERSMTLRPEGTAGVARAFVEEGMQSLPFPVRLYYNLNLFRYERVAKGRYREFHQLGAEAFGAAGPEMELELLSLLFAFFQKLGLREVSLRLNCVGSFADRKAYNEALRAYFAPHVSELCSDCVQRLELNPMRILDCKVPGCQNWVDQAPSLMDFISPTSQAHFETLCMGLDSLGIPYEVDPKIVRGLDYYTDTVFEFVSEHVGTQGTICGGGRYDALIEEMGGAPTPAVGFALGVERLLMELQAQNLLPTVQMGPDLYVGYVGDRALERARLLVHQARTLGLAAQMELTGRSVKAQLKYANRLGAHAVLILGETELETGMGRLKWMQTGTEDPVSIQEPDAWLSSLVAKRRKEES